VAYKGKLFGALLGSLAGPLGSLLGGLFGHLYDRAAEERDAEGPAGFWSREGAAPQSPSCAPISASQLSFLASLIGLSIAVANADGLVGLRKVAALKEFFRESFPYAQEDQRLLSRLIDQTFLARERLAVEELARHFAGASTPAGRRLLIRLLLKIAAADGPAVSPPGEPLIRRIAGTLGLAETEYDGLAAEFLAPEGWEYRVLGLAAEAGEEEMRSAYRRLASESHPDRFSSLGGDFVRAAEERFKLLQEAYEEVRRKRGL